MKRVKYLLFKYDVRLDTNVLWCNKALSKKDADYIIKRYLKEFGVILNKVPMEN